MWTATAVAGDAGDRYLRHFEDAVLPALQRLHGFNGAQVLRRRQPAGDELIVTTYWESEEAIRGFAGPDSEAAVVAPEARRLLAACAERGRHFEVAYMGSSAEGP